MSRKYHSFTDATAEAVTRPGAASDSPRKTAAAARCYLARYTAEPGAGWPAGTRAAAWRSTSPSCSTWAAKPRVAVPRAAEPRAGWPAGTGASWVSLLLTRL